MANQYVNKVQKSDGTTIIDITDTTATAADVATGKYFYAVSGEKTEGLNAGGNAFLISDTTDTAGGTIRTATAIEVAGTKSITDNGTYDVTSFASADVSVPASAVDTGTKSISISSNGTTTHDVVGYASASVTANVPNSYSAGDEGKVVSNGALVSQTSNTVTANDTYDTTLINSLTVNVSGGGGISVDDIATNTAPSGDVVLGSISVGNYALYNKSGITSLSGSVTAVGQHSFNYCSNITSVMFPDITGQLTGSSFANCSKLETADIGSCTQINNSSFQNCNKLTKLILRRTSVCTLQNVNAFVNTPIRGYNSGSGTIYVPNDLISSYKTASNWSTIFGEGHVTFSKIEGSIYE